MSKLLVRSLSGVVYVALVVCSIYLGHWVDSEVLELLLPWLFFSFVNVVATHEVYANLRQHGEEVNGLMGYVAGLCLIGCFMVERAEDFLGNTVDFLVIVLIFVPFITPMLQMISQLWRHDARPFAACLYGLLPVVWVSFPLVLLLNLVYEKPDLAMMTFILVWVNDSFAYLTGRAFGRHKLWERHSPNKTWEGTIGGVVCCLIVALALGPWFTGESLTATTCCFWILMGLICSVVGTLGDLVESMFKRSVGVKDSGNIMPGHGGALDRFDSMLMIAPFVYVLFLLCFD